MKAKTRNLKRSFIPSLKASIITGSITFVLLLIFLIFAPKPFYTEGFVNLEALEKYAKQTDENIQIDTANTIKPDFTSYYNTLKLTWPKKIKSKFVWLFYTFGLSKTSLWSASFFKTQLDDLIKTRTEKKYLDKFICKINTALDSKFVIIGNIQGAYHSLTRDLKKIKELGIIDQNLKVTNPNYYIIFMGDVVSRSPLTMETLSIAMKLLQVNPSNVIYLRGNHESNNYWQEHTLKTELQIRASHLSKKIVPLVKEVNAFFNTLPLALYLTIPSDKGNEFVRISDSARGKIAILNEQNFSKFLTSKTNRYTCLQLKEKEQSDAPANDINIRVIFKGEKKRETFQTMAGLRLLAPDMGSVAWNILSCPTVVYRKAVKFFHDAFIVVTPAPKVDQWKLTIYNRDMRTKDPFKSKTFNLISGVEEGKQKQPVKAPKPKPTPQVVPQPPKPAIKTHPTPPVQPKQAVPATISKHAEEISKHASQISKHAQAIKSQIKKPISKKIPTPQPQIIKKPTQPATKPTQKTTSPFESSAFKPLPPKTQQKQKET